MADYGTNFKAGHIPSYLLELDVWPEFPRMKERAEDGCAFCLLVLETLLSFDRDHEALGEVPLFVCLRFLWHKGRLTGIAIVLGPSLDHEPGPEDRCKEFYIESTDGRKLPRPT